MNVLSVEGLSKTFDMHELGDTEIVGLDDVSFDVREGEFLAVVGESGSGKSSLLKCLYRTYDPSAGHIVYHGNDGDVDLASCSDRTVMDLRADTVGYTSQFLDEIPRVPAVDVVARPLVEQGVPTSDARDRARTLLTALQVPEELWGAYPATFSGGERQRVNLAQALAPKPDLLLLDEPTSALDPETRRVAIELLESYLGTETTVIGVFHDTDVVEAVANRVVVLDDGMLQAVVPVAEFDGRIRSTAQGPSSSLAVVGGRLVTPEAVIDGNVRVEGDEIVGVGDVDADADTVIEADGRLVLPGLIDIHGDDIEQHLHPRSGARMDTSMALASADRANVAAGITTKFHAISFELDEEADRSPELAATLTEAITADDGLLVDHRLHARCEVTQQRCVEAVLEVVDNGDADMVSVMSHVPGKGQFRDIEAFRSYYENANNHTAEEAAEMIDTRMSIPMSTIRERIDRIVGRAHEAGLVTASHDDENPREVERLAGSGVDISEYPITLETAERATEVGMTTVMGAPNLVRGESQWGNLATADGIEAGVIDALVADYHPPSLLAAAFVETSEPLPERVRRVSATPADAVGFTDRGRIETGKRADLIVVDPEPTPTVTSALVAGEPVYRADATVEGSR